MYVKFSVGWNESLEIMTVRDVVQLVHRQSSNDGGIGDFIVGGSLVPTTISGPMGAGPLGAGQSGVPTQTSQPSPAYIHSRCHDAAPTWARVERGVLTLECSVCKTPVDAFQLERPGVERASSMDLKKGNARAIASAIMGAAAEL